MQGRLLEFSRMLGSGAERDGLLQALVDGACEATSSEAASILQLEEETGLLKFAAAPAHQLRGIQRARVPLHASVAGTAYTQGRAVIINDAHENPQIYREVDHLLQFETALAPGCPNSLRRPGAWRDGSGQ